MYKRMLVPLDGSELAEAVLPFATELARRLDLDLILLHVYREEEAEFASMHRGYVERACEAVRRDSEEVRERTGGQPGATAVEARCELAMGHPAENILRYADENEVDLILMATHGRSGIKRWTMGSVADKVARASRVPVWLVRAGVPGEVAYDKWPRATVLVPLDGSELAESVLSGENVGLLAKLEFPAPLDVVLLRVCEPPEPRVMPADSVAVQTPYDAELTMKWDGHVKREMTKRKREAQQYLAGVEKRLKDAGLSVRSEVLLGDPADEIVNYANRSPFNVIVMATHGRSGVSRWAYGSVAEKVLRGVSSPIFLVRPVELRGN